ncbi:MULTISPECIES: flagellar biosynthesis protein FlhB [Oceanobacillus]|uniref:Flagellar biosynthetic protein FlhB n=1 Tax=Oceanobacillus kimchii TaxID=746691 RepID=A0ABQ5TJW3_9BACI|nr:MULTISPECIES: flagellar biosynthesis protein FlhB [Oceanobacillus]MBT2598693.1 flagellar biosynthesis protein FlhB [Oceanobacillus sp. ISL-74]MBT2651612.1 flagellar biosynthesis protein FlhB [Oceanobacillus sp. ISL-73]MCT1576261.1 flagellar biosynthesis protein FlhB [Oceanobacillus kimchii]MCT2135898.1 flagellar biosynthesis protein FlhB [Oceanobacillus kimchii]OEH54678.1 EscU/YscU/HrcU family type III secretion system export apparatus switch protein [Oceanobacillus sp. E9]
MLLKLDLQFFAGEKTEKATPKKRLDERKKGRVAKSQDVNTALLLLGCFIGLFVFGSYMLQYMTGFFEKSFTEYIHWDITEKNVQLMFNSASLDAGLMLAPIMIIAIITGMAANLVQVRFLFSTEPLKFDLKKIDPIKGAKRIFSIRALVEFLKSMLKIVFVGLVTFSVIWIFKDDMLMTAFLDAKGALGFFASVTAIMGFAAIILLIFLALFDYWYQKFDFEKNIRMSKQDIKDEYKNVEGDPLIKSKIKEKQRQMATRRMMSEVPNADVIITNPTHYAIAIKYDEAKANAPYILAKGTDQIAQKIKEIAKNHGVMMVENRPLARGLHDAVEIGELIPEAYFQAVAEVLAYVYRVEKKA